jgi:RNA polymerase sigma factor (sigma-70 family)
VTDPAPAAGDPVFPAGRWDDLLDYLDPTRPGRSGADRDAGAEARYLEILRKLVAFFASRGCRDAEDMAVECVLRVAEKCARLEAADRGNPAAYFYGVARNVVHEWWRESGRHSAKRDALRNELLRLGGPAPPAWGEEAAHRCLDRCLDGLPKRSRTLVLGYYEDEGAAKVDRHRRLAEAMGKSVNALRIEVHRIRATLRQCVVACVQLDGGRGGAARGHA